jgi:hypothetical protein
LLQYKYFTEAGEVCSRRNNRWVQCGDKREHK